LRRANPISPTNIEPNKKIALGIGVAIGAMGAKYSDLKSVAV
jgi:hypothetical protein